MTGRSWLGVALAVLAWAAGLAETARAQLVEDVTIEGPISGVDPAAGTITIMGIVVRLPSGTIATPTNPSVPLDRLLDPLPGRAEGFKGGTAIAVGTSTAGQVEATEVTSDVMENVVVGEATDPDSDPATLHLNGLPVQPSTDPRLPAAPPTNELGFAIDPATIQPGTLVSAEGYVSTEDGILRYHTLQADAANLVNAGVHEVSITRAQCRDEGDEVEIRGGVHVPIPATGTPPSPTGTVQVILVDSGEPLGAPIPVDPAADQPGFADYRLRVREQGLAGCEQAVRASYNPGTGEGPFLSPDVALEVP